jgi:hypothetical protein
MLVTITLFLKTGHEPLAVSTLGNYLTMAPIFLILSTTNQLIAKDKLSDLR